LLLEVARARPRTWFSVVAGRDNAPAGAPPNVSLEVDLPFAEMKRRLEQARVVALPVRENTYSGATTVLLQALALGKPVVVSRTSAIESGYGLVDGENCRLVPPGDAETFGRSLGEVLADEEHARVLGANARSTVERSLTWDRYVDRIEAVLVAAAASGRAGSPPS
jgi:glycosyltransferase involved in cell wall biosynthesis